MFQYTKSGITKYITKKFEEATIDFINALEYDSNNIFIKYWLANSYFENNNYYNAIKVAENIIQQDSEFAPAYILRGLVRDVLNIPGAREDFLKVNSIHPDILNTNAADGIDFIANEIRNLVYRERI